jgi:23S rRNA pseudouridine1911/1915/1917 synthase
MSDTMTASDVLTATVSAGDAGLRLDKFLASALPDFSRARLQTLIEQGHVTCWGKAAADASGKVKEGETYCVSIPEAVPTHMQPQAIALDIVYEDNDLLVINKPAGLTVHPGAGNPDMTLANALLAHCGDSLSGIGGVARPGIVHRIDKDTTGLLVAAKNDAAHLALSAQLADRSLSRTYLALVWGEPSPGKGTITGNIDRSFSNRQKMAVVNKGGRPAVTHYEVVSSLQSPVVSLVQCKLETGRTHQIRVHFAHIGHPLVGDPLYGAPAASKLNSKAGKTLPDAAKKALLSFERQALHAKKIGFIHPTTGKAMQFECELPEDMKRLIAALS